MTHHRKHLLVLVAFAAAVALPCIPMLAADPPVVQAVPKKGEKVAWQPPPPPPEVDVAGRAAAIDSLPSVFCADVLADPEALPEVAADAPAYSLLLSAQPRMFGTAGSALASDLRALLQPAWVPDGDRLLDCTLKLRDWPGPPIVTTLAKYSSGGALIFIATSNWAQRAAMNTSPGERLHWFPTHEALAERVLELCRRFLAPQFVPGDAKDIVDQTKFLLLADGKTGVLRGRRGPLWIWSDGQTLVAAGRLFNRAISIPLAGLEGNRSAGDPPALQRAVTVNGRSVLPQGGGTSLVNGCTIVPLRAFCAGVGADVRWIAETNAAIVEWANRAAWFQEGNRVGVLDGAETEIPVAPYIVEGKMMVPLRPLVRWLGGTLAWHENERMIHVYVPPPQLPPLAASAEGPELAEPEVQVTEPPDETMEMHTEPTPGESANEVN